MKRKIHLIYAGDCRRHAYDGIVGRRLIAVPTVAVRTESPNRKRLLIGVVTEDRVLPMAIVRVSPIEINRVFCGDEALTIFEQPSDTVVVSSRFLTRRKRNNDVSRRRVTLLLQ